MNELRATAKIKVVKTLSTQLQKTPDPHEAVVLLQAIVLICDTHQLEVPIDAVRANIGLDNYFGCDVLALR